MDPYRDNACVLEQGSAMIRLEADVAGASRADNRLHASWQLRLERTIEWAPIKL